MSNDLIFNPIFFIFAVPIAVLVAFEIARIVRERLDRFRLAPGAKEDLEALEASSPNEGFMIKQRNSAARRHFVDDDLLQPRLRLGWNITKKAQRPKRF